jgi:CRISPR-associated protein Cmr3
MSTAAQWILIDPLDTLFFKSSEPMVAGENHEVRSVFPPVPSTLCGAICTAVLRQRGIDPAEFVIAEKGLPAFPMLGNADALGIEVIGPLLHVDFKDGTRDWFMPAPANWFVCEPDPSEKGSSKAEVTVADVLPDAFSCLGMKGSNPFPVWVMKPKGLKMKGLSGHWANAAALVAVSHQKREVRIHGSVGTMSATEPLIAPLAAFHSFEPRAGIALDNETRRVKKGHLYSTTQVRLQAGVRIAVGLRQTLIPSHLNREGALQLGGEQRVSRYEGHPQGPVLPTGRSAWVMTLSVLPFESLEQGGLENFPRFSGPLVRMGGWDMKKRFHKPMKAYLPQGTVIRIGEEASVPQGFIRI